jgi:hypothetical protein
MHKVAAARASAQEVLAVALRLEKLELQTLEAAAAAVRIKLQAVLAALAW